MTDAEDHDSDILVDSDIAMSSIAETGARYVAVLPEELERLREVCSGPGWDSYGALGIDDRAIDAAMRLLEMFPGREPFICPTVDGGVQVSWANEQVFWEFSPEGKFTLACFDDTYLTEEND